MNCFENILEKRITSIQRLDTSADYEFHSPYAIIFTIEGQTEKLIISATNDGTSVDVRLTTDQQIESDYGLEFSESILNALKNEDELSKFIGDTIESIKIAEYISQEIAGVDFVIQRGKFAGVDLKTKEHKLLFHNNYGGWCDIDDNIAELPNKDSLRWK